MPFNKHNQRVKISREELEKIVRVIKAENLKECTCPNCLTNYFLGVNGTVTGCDRCEGIVRMSNGMIDERASSPEIFIRHEANR